MKSSADVPSENIRLHFIGQDQNMGIYARELLIPEGYFLVSHSHHYDHLSILASGTVEWTAGGVTETLTGPCAITVPARAHHTLRAITDAVWFCIHPTNETDTGKVDETLVEKELV